MGLGTCAARAQRQSRSPVPRSDGSASALASAATEGHRASKEASEESTARFRAARSADCSRLVGVECECHGGGAHDAAAAARLAVTAARGGVAVAQEGAERGGYGAAEADGATAAAAVVLPEGVVVAREPPGFEAEEQVDRVQMESALRAARRKQAVGQAHAHGRIVGPLARKKSKAGACTLLRQKFAGDAQAGRQPSTRCGRNSKGAPRASPTAMPSSAPTARSSANDRAPAARRAAKAAELPASSASEWATSESAWQSRSRSNSGEEEKLPSSRLTRRAPRPVVLSSWQPTP